MPGRKIPLITGELYHVFNRGNNRQPTFTNKREYNRFKETINFYRVLKPPMNLSRFLRLDESKKENVHKVLKQSKRLVEIYCYCLMPNHFHFLLKQVEDQGVAKFMSNLQNSYTKYFNSSHERDGSLFLDQFKAVRIETDEQLVHVSRYIHLNPYTGYVVKSLEELESYPWSSFPDYFQNGNTSIEKNLILDFFKNSQQYKKFVFDQADYQRKLKEIEHLLLENP